MPLVQVQVQVSVQLPQEELSPPKRQAWELPVVREELRELSALWALEKLVVELRVASEELPVV